MSGYISAFNVLTYDIEIYVCLLCCDVIAQTMSLASIVHCVVFLKHFEALLCEKYLFVDGLGWVMSV